jgi:dTMP kinase
MYKPSFIVFEGPDGAGKTTLTTRITSWLNEELKIPTNPTHNPGGTPFADALRSLVFSGIVESKQAELLGFLAAEVDCFEAIILPSFARNINVIADRWLMSARIYQSFMANRPPDAIEKLIQAALPHPSATPNFYVVLNAKPEVLMERALAAQQDESAESDEASKLAAEGQLNYFKGLHEAYARPMVFSDGVPCLQVDTTDQTADEVYDSIREIIMKSVLHT